MENLGQKLKAAREQAGISLNEVATSTKIGMRTLQAIEEGDTDELPPRTFLRGFVQTYAKYLKLDHKEILAQFAAEYDTSNEFGEEPTLTEELEKIDVISAEQKEEKAPPIWLSSLNIFNDSALKTKALGIAGTVVLILFIIFTKSTYEKYQKEGIQPPPSAIEDMVSEAKEIIPQEATPHTGPAPTVVEPETVEEVKNEVTTPETPKEEPKPIEVKKEEPKQDIIAATPPKKEEIKKELPSNNNNEIAAPQEVIIEALDSVTIDFRIDNGALQSVKLVPEQVHIIKAKFSLAIDITDGGVVSIVHNGKDIGVPGDLGKKIKIKFPQ